MGDPHIRCTWDRTVRALYIFFDGSKVGSTPKPTVTRTIQITDTMNVDLGLDDNLVGVEVLAEPTCAPVLPANLATTRYVYLVVGRAWEQAQQRNTDPGRARFYDWLLTTGRSE